MKALVQVTLKPDVLDPQGKAIRSACGQLGYARGRERAPGQAVRDRARRRGSEAEARRLLEELAGKLLANPVIEDYAILKIEA